MADPFWNLNISAIRSNHQYATRQSTSVDYTSVRGAIQTPSAR